MGDSETPPRAHAGPPTRLLPPAPLVSPPRTPLPFPLQVRPDEAAATFQGQTGRGGVQRRTAPLCERSTTTREGKGKPVVRLALATVRQAGLHTLAEVVGEGREHLSARKGTVGFPPPQGFHLTR